MKKLYLLFLSIVTICVVLVTFLKVIALYSNNKSYVEIPVYWNKEEVKRLHRYHGTLSSFEERGEYYFYRNGGKCRLWDPKARQK